VFPVRYELTLYILFIRNSGFKKLMLGVSCPVLRMISTMMVEVITEVSPAKKFGENRNPVCEADSHRN
jgi:hypothetical protein